MVQVQRHECRPKKCFGKCEEGDPKVCRYGYPRERCDEDLGRSETTGRYIYRCEDKEDERLSPYIPLWLLATGARCPATCVWDATRVSLYSNLENTTIHHSTCPKIWQDAYLSKAGACMNIQRVDDAVFLAYIAKYVTKPEPHGFMSDTSELRAREEMSDGERFLNARVVGMPEAVHRAWGFCMRAGTNVVHLTTKPPYKRMRAIPRSQGANSESDSESDSGENGGASAKELRFADGVLEHYMNRPIDDDGQSEYWENMTYPDFHRMYRCKLGKNVCKSDVQSRKFYACTDAGKVLVDGEEIDGSAMYCVPCFARSDKTRPVVIDWTLPDKHGQDYYYQQLLLKVPFRCADPGSFISPSNSAGTLEQECILRGIVPSEADGGMPALIRSDAEKRLFTEEQIEAFIAHFKAHQEVMAGTVLSEAASTRVATDLGLAPADVQRLHEDIESARREEPPCEAPDVRIEVRVRAGRSHQVAVWHEEEAEGRQRVWELTPSQYEAYKLLLEAGDRQLLTFLSGEGGMGKSLLIRLLVQHWRSKGKRVLVCAASAKAARLIGGHTVHSAFKLRLNGGFYETQLDGTEKHTKQWAWLFTRDIIIIDEISMLTAGALHGVNHALNHVMSLSMSKESNVTFGEKSILAVGDLFQLPAVERFRFKEQAPLTH
jgi:hypothetical protein